MISVADELVEEFLAYNQNVKVMKLSMLEDQVTPAKSCASDNSYLLWRGRWADLPAATGQGQWVAGSPSISPRKAPNSPTWVPSPRTSSATLPRPRRGSSCDDACSPMSWLASARWAVTTPRQLASAGGVSPSAGGAAKSTAISPADRPVDRMAVDLRTLEPPGV